MNSVTQEMNNETQTQAAQPPRSYAAPGVNILETADAYYLEAELPGVKRDGLTVSVEDNILTLVGHRTASPEAKALYRESAGADFRRTFVLDPSIEADRISAAIEQGLLTVTLPKAEKAKLRQIAVN